jgi:hypothetical protein
MKQNIQTTLFPELEAKPVHKPSPKPLEKGFMLQVMDYASKIGLPNIHVQTFHENSFWVTCSCCGQRTLATCRKPVNTDLAGWPDILFVSAGIECKREGFEPTELQIKTHERLKRQGVPVMTGSPENINEITKFIHNLTKGRK